MFKGFGQPKPKRQDELKEFVDNRLNTYHWLKDKVANDAETSQALAQCVMRFSKWELPKAYEEDDFKIHMGRLLAADYYVRMALMLANQGMPIEQMTNKFIIDAVRIADDEQLVSMPTA